MRHENEQRGNPRNEEAARLAEAAAILRRVRQETDPQVGALASRLATGVGSRLSGAGVDPHDPIERWGTRIGRSLSLLVFVGLGLLLAWQFGS